MSNYMHPVIDPYFRVDVLAKTSNPNKLSYAALHQDYSEEYVYDELKDSKLTEERCGDIIEERILPFGHFGTLEHESITFNVGYFPHSVMQQARTHRISVSFDVQCLSADTVITLYGKASKKHNKSIGKLYDLWENGEEAVRTEIYGNKSKPFRRDCKNRIRKMGVRSLDEQTNLFVTNHIEDIVYNGINPVYRVTLEDGKTIKCTKNHKIFTPVGWKTLSELTEESEVMVNGIPVDTTNRLKSHPVKIVSIEYVGLEPTYDLVMKDPHHNFVANGIVVHNSFRYSGKRILDVLDGTRTLDEVFYFRPLGNYTDRKGTKYEYTEAMREADKYMAMKSIEHYSHNVRVNGFSEEHARGCIGFDIRQHFVVTFNVRSLMHFLDMRAKKDAQLEIQWLCELMLPHFQEWMPEVSAWYIKHRLGKNKLAP